MFEVMNDPKAVRAGLVEFLRVWPDTHLQSVLPGLPGIVQEAIDLLRSMDQPPVTSMDYIVKAVREGVPLEICGDVPVTHVSFVGGTPERRRVILRTQQCPCICHDPTKGGIIMHSQACCEPYR